MARPIKGDIRVETTKVRKSDKLIYVYERTVKYNPELRRNEILSANLLEKSLLRVTGSHSYQVQSQA